MAQIDTSIYNRQLVPDAMGSVQRGLSMREMIDDQKVKRQARENQQSIKDAYSQGITKGPEGKYSVDRQKTLSALAKGNHPQAFMQAKAGFQKQDQDASNQKFLDFKRKTDASGKLIDNMFNQDSYSKALEQADTLGIDLTDFPKQYDEGFVNKARTTLMGVKNKLADEARTRGLDLQEASLKSQIYDRKQKNVIARERIKSQSKTAQKVAGSKPTKFTDERQKAAGKAYVKAQETRPMVSNLSGLIDSAINAQIEYSLHAKAGTGPFATGMGLKKYFSQDTADLNALLKKLNLKNMIKTFAGMSKAIDTDGERMAWDGTQADISNDDRTNMKILLSQKSLILKNLTELDSKRDYVEKYETMDGYRSPILNGEFSSMMSPTGQMQLINKKEVKDKSLQGFMTVDEYANENARGKETSQPKVLKPNQTFKTNEIEW